MGTQMIQNMAAPPANEHNTPRNAVTAAPRRRPDGAHTPVVPQSGPSNSPRHILPVRSSRPTVPSPLGQHLYGPGGGPVTTPAYRHSMGSAPLPIAYPMPGQPGFGSQRPLMPRPPPGETSGVWGKGYDSDDSDDDDDKRRPSAKRPSNNPKVINCLSFSHNTMHIC